MERTAQEGTELPSSFPYLYSRRMLAVPSRNISAEQKGMLVGDPESQTCQYSNYIVRTASAQGGWSETCHR